MGGKSKMEDQRLVSNLTVCHREKKLPTLSRDDRNLHAEQTDQQAV